jgi:spore germination protein
MIIHTVKPDETIYTIAEQYKIPYERLEKDNSLPHDYRLNIGQALIIAQPEQIYIVQEGDTLDKIASSFGVTIKQLLRNNPEIMDMRYLYEGEELIISYDTKDKKIEVMGYTSTYITQQILSKTLPFLTYITILNYTVSALGTINTIDDEEIIRMAKAYDVEPIMFLSSLSITGKGNYSITHSILGSNEIQDRLIETISSLLKAKGYYGLNISFYNVLPEDLQAYVTFIEKITNRLHEEGYKIFVSLTPFTFGYEPGVPYRKTYYSDIGKIVDYVILISYLWATATISQVAETTYFYLNQYIEYAITQIPPEKIFIGLSRIAYDWELPYVEGYSVNTSLSNTAAIDLAHELGIDIQFNDVNQTPYFNYVSNGVEHYVWFKDSRSVNAILSLVERYNLNGLAVWNISYYFSQTWLTISSQYDIKSLNDNNEDLL